MRNWRKGLGAGVLAASLIYLLAAFSLASGPDPQIPEPGEGALNFSAAMTADYADLPRPSAFTARDGAVLNYRLYGDPASARRLLILLHGSGWHGMQFHVMARALAQDGKLLVIAPDLRGHGAHPQRRGDVDRIGRLEEDLADLIAHAKSAFTIDKTAVGGHSSGGGLALRFAGGAYGRLADGFLLMAPFLKYDAPTTRPDSGGWAHPATRRIIGLNLLNAVGITALNHRPVIAFDFPKAVLEGPYGATATQVYSYRMNVSFSPRPDYEGDLAAIRVPLLLLAGANDEAFDSSAYEPVISAQTPMGRYHILPLAGHVDLLTDARSFRFIRDWLEEAFGPS